MLANNMTTFKSAADQEADVATFVHPETLVYTKNGPKPIKDIRLSDTLSSGAKLSDIMQLPFEGHLVNINGNLVGPHHKLSVLQGSQEAIKHDVAAPKWLPAAAIAEGDYLEFTIPTASETVPLSEDDCWLLGVTVGQGKQSGSDVELPRSAITDTLVRHCEDTKVPYVSAKSGAVTFQSPFNTSLIFRPDGSKSLAPELLHMSNVQLEAFTSGLEEKASLRDSCNATALKGRPTASHDDKFQLETTSLAAQVQFMYLGRGIMTHLDGNGQLARTGEQPQDWFAHGNSLFWKVTQKEQYAYNGPVYDLQIAGGLGEDPDTEPSYMTSGGLHHNGGGKRNGSIAVYVEPWHGDVLEFVALKRNHGDEALRCRDLFLALWINDLFMKRVEADGMWSLMCPNTSPGLSDVYDKDDEHMDFTNLYERYEAEGKFQKQIKARELWDSIIVSQIETGVPYMLYKDAVNRKTNQSNLGTIKSSNLCCEVCQYSSADETSVCNLASVALKAFVKCFEDKPAEFDFHELHKVIKVMTRNLNNVIDLNYYPVETARNSNMKHRPIGLGVQGLADAFMMMRYPFESAEAQALNKDIFETIYHAALEASCEMAAERETEVLEYKQLAAIDDKPKELKRQLTQILKKTKFTQEELTREKCCGSYDSYLWNGGCPLSKGIFQFDMWDVKPSDRWNWTSLLEQIDVHGVRNSLLVAPMPTASTSQILGNFECFEAPTSNIFTRRTLAGEFIVANKYMLRDLIDRGLWTESIRARVIAAGGSIQDIEEIPDDIKALYKTMWEVKMRTVIDMARDRGAFVDQSQSMNLYMANPTLKNMTSMHFYAWKAALKTGCYYIRTRAKARPQQFTVDPLLLAKQDKPETSLPTAEEVLACSLENKRLVRCVQDETHIRVLNFVIRSSNGHRLNLVDCGAPGRRWQCIWPSSRWNQNFGWESSQGHEIVAEAQGITWWPH